MSFGSLSYVETPSINGAEVRRGLRDSANGPKRSYFRRGVNNLWTFAIGRLRYELDVLASGCLAKFCR